ncbi:metalloregulator ArsR/SmtB family transcription factor [Cellulomonas sp. NPDC089187]|uniref:metalloregulator ArsR/SmtB family transcription factor n=1 Tax=Cellulomonas sp. NPDC089187 TaxID=3154970 RepID=UPI003440213B
MSVDQGCAPVPAAEQAMAVEVAERTAVALKALADPLRLRMVSLIAIAPGQEACVCDLATVAEVSQPTVSHHLRVLKDAGLVLSERRGTWVYYRLSPAHRTAVTALLSTFATTEAAALSAPPEVDAELDGVVAELSSDFSGLDPTLVSSVVRESAAALARTGGGLDDAGRFARQRLTDLSRDDDRPHVLFVCTANAGRSQLAAALARHYAGDSVVVRSAGSTPAAQVHATVRPLLAELGADGHAYPKPLTDDAVRAADVVVTMGCGDRCPTLPDTRYEDWVVGDPALASPDGARAIRDDLDRRVRALLGSLLPDLTPSTA